jgi:hypothetical protein
LRRFRAINSFSNLHSIRTLMMADVCAVLMQVTLAARALEAMGVQHDHIFGSAFVQDGIHEFRVPTSRGEELVTSRYLVKIRGCSGGSSGRDSRDSRDLKALNTFVKSLRNAIKGMQAANRFMTSKYVSPLSNMVTAIESLGSTLSCTSVLHVLRNVLGDDAAVTTLTTKAYAKELENRMHSAGNNPLEIWRRWLELRMQMLVSHCNLSDDCFVNRLEHEATVRFGETQFTTRVHVFGGGHLEGDSTVQIITDLLTCQDLLEKQLVRETRKRQRDEIRQTIVLMKECYISLLYDHEMHAFYDDTREEGEIYDPSAFDAQIVATLFIHWSSSTEGGRYARASLRAVLLPQGVDVGKMDLLHSTLSKVSAEFDEAEEALTRARDAAFNANANEADARNEAVLGAEHLASAAQQALAGKRFQPNEPAELLHMLFLKCSARGCAP